MKKINLCLLLLVFVLSVSSTTSFAQRKKRGLDSAAGKKAETGPQITPNIHMQLGCESCHLTRPKPDDKDAKLLMPNNDVVELCRSCHEGAEHHKVNVVPSADVKIPDFLPLGKSGASEGKVVCSTCHLVHVEIASNVLLRGFSDEAGGQPILKKRLDLCNKCHGEEFTKRSPHVNDEKLCGFCHSSDPKKAKDVVKETIKRDIIELCDFCHGSAQGGHFIQVNPFADKAIRNEFPTTLPVIDGAMTCATCHNGHGNTGTMYILRPDYISFAVKSKEINPHEKGLFCLSCHDKIPAAGAKGADAFIKFGNDVAMCNWCHKASQDKGDHHPLNVGESPNSKITKMSKDLPLVDGKVTCLTCHERKFECRAEKPKENIADKNPNYLIGGPYDKKNEICYKCHIRAELEKTNPHKMLDDKGNQIASTCKFCHSLPAEKLVEGGKNPGLIGEVNFLCILCHADRDHPGTKMDGTQPRHLVKFANERQTVANGKIITVKIKSLKDLKDVNTNLLPLDNAGNITCNTCHQVHQEGLLKSEKNKRVEGKMWRMSQDELCNTCHSF
ncbi:MAG: cytochrome c3 family protein [bacterium]|nr:cytochrome c3 family protein [bacterium]